MSITSKDAIKALLMKMGAGVGKGAELLGKGVGNGLGAAAAGVAKGGPPLSRMLQAGSDMSKRNPRTAGGVTAGLAGLAGYGLSDLGSHDEEEDNDNQEYEKILEELKRRNESHNQ